MCMYGETMTLLYTYQQCQIDFNRDGLHSEVKANTVKVEKPAIV